LSLHVFEAKCLFFVCSWIWWLCFSIL
jgi:hypothetical protein